MLAKILHTLSSRIGAAGLSFLIVVLTAQFLGAAGRGEVSIFTANLTVILLFTGLIGGTGLVYLAPRINFYQLLLPAYLWSGAVCGLGTLTLLGMGQSPPETIWHLFGLSLLLAFFSVNTTILLGRDQVKTHNYLTLLQTLITAGTLAFGFLVLGQPTVLFYLKALYLAYGITGILSFAALLQLPEKPAFTGFTRNLKQLWQIGTVAQISNIITFLNYRLGYYFLQTLAGLEAVGIFSVAVTLSEAIWMIGKSLATVQYAKLVNTESKAEAQELTIKLTRLSFAVTFMAVLVLAVLPPELLRFIFGKEFGQVKPIIWALGLGIIATGTGMIFSHYFAGRGKYVINNWAALCGLAFTVIGCLVLIPRLGALGAGLACSVSYLAAFTFLFWRFRRESGFGFRQLFPTKTDWQEVKKLLNRSGK